MASRATSWSLPAGISKRHQTLCLQKSQTKKARSLSGLSTFNIAMRRRGSLEQSATQSSGPKFQVLAHVRRLCVSGSDHESSRLLDQHFIDFLNQGPWCGRIGVLPSHLHWVDHWRGYPVEGETADHITCEGRRRRVFIDLPIPVIPCRQVLADVVTDTGNEPYTVGLTDHCTSKTAVQLGQKFPGRVQDLVRLFKP